MSVPLQLRRRRLLSTAAACCFTAPSVWAQVQKSSATGPVPTVVHIADMSPANIDVSKDFVVGARAAWQDIQRKGGLRGKPIQYQTVEVDGSMASVRAAVDAAQAQGQVVALMGSVGGNAAQQIADYLDTGSARIAHVAPWLQNAKLARAESTFAIFATRQAQVEHALKSLAAVGISEIGAVYASQSEQANYGQGVEAAAKAQQVRCKTLGNGSNLQLLGQTLTADSPRIIVFMGGTPELVQFAQGIGKQVTQRYIVAMSDVNLLTLQQMGTSPNAAVIATQVVPLVNANLPVVRAYRETLSRLFDEPPTPHSLAGFIAARYCAEVLSGVDGVVTRATALQAFQRRGSIDLGGLTVDGQPGRASSAYVTQSMLSAQGRVIG